MKLKLITLLFLSISISVVAQQNGTLLKTQLPRVYIDEEISLHFLSPEPIQYVDISTNDMIGDIPLENVFRVKAVRDSVSDLNGYNKSLGVVTIIGQKFIAQYDLWYSHDERQLKTQIEILPINTNPLEVGEIPMSDQELRFFATEAFKDKKKNKITQSTQYGITGKVNKIYTVDDYIFLDISFKNKTNLKFDLDQLRFKIEDKRILKATNVQSIEIEPEYQLFSTESFDKKYRNIYVFKKVTFPNSKVFTIELTESQISGRSLKMRVKYSDLLNADTL
ncbi:Bacteroides conjugative transposon TraN protein [Algoriphagus locisalis]|jgi:conjugative transposon TraN protein|uniref:Bacteroides conjugative transposon TraN protein n=1 Tax=Algoriphagus locisalis TaxID=305507 RepID=A0A1I7A8U0_9BACT|nr:conjugative transposon protein TraN [Algoriphagus locisalis]SFT71336.1 Bacteroides conjugative transposon TraN protein [Algoriphagus locisalis]